MMNRIITILICTILMFILLSLHSKENNTVKTIESDYTTVSTVDSQRKNVELGFSKVPQKVIANRIYVAETLIALGVEKNILAVNYQNTDRYKEYLPQYKEQADNLRRITFDNLTMEEAVSLQPDFIIGWLTTFDSKGLGTTDFWNKRGVNTYINTTSNGLTKHETIEDQEKFILDMGKIFQKEAESKELVDNIETAIKTTINSKSKYKRVLVLENEGRGFRNYDSDTLAGNMVERLNGQIVSQGRVLSYEEVIKINPEVIFLVYFNKDRLIQLKQIYSIPALNSVNAIKNKRVYPIRLDYIYTPGVRIVEGLKIMRKGLYDE
ncbi:ABC transporter substrate-binding protein [uncultured Phascolarctobacterium sp.]|uniref:ABC transporter substrate-binding protein n=1 Tax=uncultured Phascolarctobacterium sp. TaxID=512296 RepID=UPI0025D78144|nr:ABC transporter substrate-binding protein [uncultured Phascolarctobacterium sp.]